MSPKVHVVTTGQYSDYRIAAIFSARDAAERYLHVNDTGEHPYDTGRIEEWSIDEISEPVSVIPWQASIDCDTGEIMWTHKANWSEVIQRGMRAGPVDIHEVTDQPRKAWIIVTSYASEEHAKKLAIEARQKWLREKRSLPNR